MSDFEKKTLSYAFCWTYFLAIFPHRVFLHTPINRLLDMTIAGVGLLVLCILWTVFGLWKVGWNSGGYFREDNLTEREKFLSYKATSKTLPVFISVWVVVWTVWSCYLTISGKEDKLIIDSLDIAVAFATTVIAFLAIKSYVLFAFLRKERLSQCKK